jgi:hypothetical protein
VCPVEVGEACAQRAAEQAAALETTTTTTTEEPTTEPPTTTTGEPTTAPPTTTTGEPTTAPPTTTPGEPTTTPPTTTTGEPTTAPPTTTTGEPTTAPPTTTTGEPTTAPPTAAAAPCASNPCQNGGQCKERGGGFKCKCAPEFSGDTCEVAETPAPAVTETPAPAVTETPAAPSGEECPSGTPLFGTCYGNADIGSVTESGDCLVSGFDCDLLSATYGTLALCGEVWSTVCPMAGQAPAGFGTYSTLKDICCESCQSFEGTSSSDFGTCGAGQEGSACDDGNAKSTFDECNANGQCEGLVGKDEDASTGATIKSESDPYNPTFQASNALFHAGKDTADNQWLLPSKTKGGFTVDLGSEKPIIGVKILNTANGKKDLRGTADFSVYVGNKDKLNSMTLALSNTLKNIDGQSSPSAETFSFAEKFTARYVSFQVDSYLNKGAGLQYFSPIVGVPSSTSGGGNNC